MKHLHITRHGKSSWDFENISDIDRPLNERGVNNAYMMARRLTERKIKPDLLISSPAVRALSTAVIFMRVMEMPPESLRINEDIYMGYVDEVIRVIKGVEDSCDKLMIFGHNPTFTALANRFLSESVDNIPTAGIVSVKIKTDHWKKITEAKVASEFFDYPKRV